MVVHAAWENDSSACDMETPSLGTDVTIRHRIFQFESAFGKTGEDCAIDKQV